MYVLNMNNLKIALGILVILSASRFIPHPPNFTSLIALSFYIPVFFGLKFIPFVVIAFAITDFFIGFHQLTLFTWGSVILIGLCAKYLKFSISRRAIGAFLGCLIFYLITNLGVWLLSNDPLILETLLMTYIDGIPFFGNTIMSTILYGILIETIYHSINLKKKLKIN